MHRLTLWLIRWRKARHAKWLRKNRVLIDPCAAATDPRCRLEAGKVRP